MGKWEVENEKRVGVTNGIAATGLGEEGAKSEKWDVKNKRREQKARCVMDDIV